MRPTLGMIWHWGEDFTKEELWTPQLTRMHRATGSKKNLQARHHRNSPPRTSHRSEPFSVPPAAFPSKWVLCAFSHPPFVPGESAKAGLKKFNAHTVTKEGSNPSTTILYTKNEAFPGQDVLTATSWLRRDLNSESNASSWPSSALDALLQFWLAFPYLRTPNELPNKIRRFVSAYETILSMAKTQVGFQNGVKEAVCESN